MNNQETFKKAIETQSIYSLENLAQQMGDGFTNFINTPLEDYNLPLILAVETGAKDIVTYLLDHGADINKKGLGETALGTAAQKGDAAILELLLSYKPDINAKSDDGRFSALYWAAWKGYTDIVSLLLSAKAKVDIKTSDRETPLYAAARNGHFNVVKLLVEKGAKVNMICSDGSDTALCIACGMDHSDIVQYLLTHGANPNGIGDETSEDFYSFPLHSTSSGAVAELLLAAGAEIHAKNRHQDTALHSLVRRVHYPDTQGIKREKLLQAIEVLLANGAEPLAQNNNHVNTPLALSESPEVTALLQSAIVHKNASGKGKQENPKINLGEPMFKMAHSCDKAEQVAALITLLQQADIDDVRYKSPEDNDATILHNIVNSAPSDHKYRQTPFAPYLEAITLLLEKGADVNAMGSIWKETPLHSAVRRSSYAGRQDIKEYHEGYETLIQLLIHHQASLVLPDRDGCVPLDQATYGPIIDLLKLQGATYAALSNEVVNQIKEGRMDVFEKGMPIELKDKEGNTPLLVAALKNSIPAIEYLVRNGADINARNIKWKNNALDIACLACSFDAIRYLVSHVAIDINALDPVSDDTALHYLAAWQPNFHVADPAGMKKMADEICVWMVQQGAAINIKNKGGKTAIDMARTKKLAAEMTKAAKNNKKGNHFYSK